MVTVDITAGNITVRLSGVATHCGTMVQPDNPSGVTIVSYTYGMAGTGYQVVNPTPVGDATAITSTVAPGTVLAALDSLVVLFVRSPRPTPTPQSANDEAIAIVVVPYAVDPGEVTTRIRPSAIGNPSNPTIAAHRATSLMFNTTAANNIPSVINIDTLPTTWGTFGNLRPNIDTFIARYAGFCGELWTGWGTASHTPSQQHPGYGAGVSSWSSEGLLMIVSTDDAAKRKTLAFRMTQWGVDLYGAFVSGRNDKVDGGHMQGRKALVVLAGHMLELSPLLNATTTFPLQFNEDEQFYTASPAWPWGWPYGYRGHSDFAWNLSSPIGSWNSTVLYYLPQYFGQEVCGTQLGTAVAMRILGRTAEMGVGHYGMMQQWMAGPSAGDLATMAAVSTTPPLSNIQWGTSYSYSSVAWPGGPQDFGRAAWEAYGDYSAGLDATGSATVPVSASGAAGVSIANTGNATVPIGASGSSSLSVSATGGAAVPLVAVGAASLQIASSGQAGVPVTAVGASTVGAVGIVTTGSATVSVSAVGSAVLSAPPSIPAPPPQQAPKAPTRAPAPWSSRRGGRFQWRPPWG